MPDNHAIFVAMHNDLITQYKIQLKLVNSKSMGPEEIIRVIRSSS